MRTLPLISLALALNMNLNAQQERIDDAIARTVESLTASHFELYTDLHRNPEPSLLEFKTAEKMAARLREMGFEVTTGIGGTGVVGVFHNGPGKTIMLRTDMDALPVKENTGLPYSSTVIMKDAAGIEQPVMHACGHDLHMTVWLGTLKTLVTLRSEWQGTIVAVAQSGEEVSFGAKAMIEDGLFKKFPKPDYALAYHVSAELPAGTVGYYPGPIFAGVKSAEITVYGSGGHGAMPHTTIDPIVIAARIILDIQTIVSRTINPVKPAVVTVGAINGGSKHNVIPDEVKMLLTIRYFEDEILEQIKESLYRITRGAAVAAGLPEDKMPLVYIEPAETAPVSNDPQLVMSSVGFMRESLGNDNVIQVDPMTVAEDFGKYGTTEEKIPIALFWLGGVNHDLFKDHQTRGTFLPPLHNAAFHPDFQPTFRGGVTAMSAVMISLFTGDSTGQKSDPELPQPATKIILPMSVLENYAGEYKIVEGPAITITVVGTRLFYQQAGRGSIELYPLSETQFYIEADNSRIEFLKDEKDFFNSLTITLNGKKNTARRIKKLYLQ
ncbi:MAG: amidohydrolase [Bacteroidales bacterium]